MSKILITSDLHLNLKEDDQYRWDFLKRLPDIIEEKKISQLYILGDLTHDKDRHPSKLVNRACNLLTDIAYNTPIMILKGNHDYVDPDCPFMGFLHHLQAITFVVDPFDAGLSKNWYYLPHTKDPMKDWKHLLPFKPKSIVFMHQTVGGALASNGTRLEGLSRKIFSDCDRVFSGDIHVPQRLGKVTYVGTPYPVHFGDYFSPRFLVYDSKRDKLVSVVDETSPRKISLKISHPEMIEDIDNIRPGDYVKVQIQLRRANFPEWKSMRKKTKELLESKGAIERGIEVKEIKRVRLVRNKTVSKGPLKRLTDEQTIKAFCDRESLGDDMREFAKDLL